MGIFAYPAKMEDKRYFFELIKLLTVIVDWLLIEGIINRSRLS